MSVFLSPFTANLAEWVDAHPATRKDASMRKARINQGIAGAMTLIMALGQVPTSGFAEALNSPELVTTDQQAEAPAANNDAALIPRTRAALQSARRRSRTHRSARTMPIATTAPPRTPSREPPFRRPPARPSRSMATARRKRTSTTLYIAISLDRLRAAGSGSSIPRGRKSLASMH